jgi:hypothetical protein
VKPFASFQEDFDMSGGYRAVVKGGKKKEIEDLQRAFKL